MADESVGGVDGVVGCSALLAAPFHLRPRAVTASVGPEYPAGTRVSVLALTGARRARAGGDATSSLPTATSVLSRVRVDADGAEGFAFVRPIEFAATCPVLAVDLGEDPGALTPAALPAHQSRAAALRRFTDLSVERRFDADGDGAPDELLSVREGREGSSTGPMEWFVLVHRGAEGFTVSFLEGVTYRDCHQEGLTRQASVVATAPTPTVVFFAYPCDGGATYDVFRWVGVGGMRQVFSQVVDLVGERILWSADPDGALRATGRESRRSQRLRWDDARQRFVPEGGALCVRSDDHDDCGSR